MYMHTTPSSLTSSLTPAAPAALAIPQAVRDLLLPAPPLRGPDRPPGGLHRDERLDPLP